MIIKLASKFIDLNLAIDVEFEVQMIKSIIKLHHTKNNLEQIRTNILKLTRLKFTIKINLMKNHQNLIILHFI